MSERERWIIYPLLFFALGAAIRDKILHRIDVKEIYCESLQIVDQQDPYGRPLVKLGIQRGAPSEDPAQAVEQVGMLSLYTNEGERVAQVSAQAVFQILSAQQVESQRLIGKELRILDGKNRPLVLAGIANFSGPPLVDGKPTVTPHGVILLDGKQALHAPMPGLPRPKQKPDTEL